MSIYTLMQSIFDLPSTLTILHRSIGLIILIVFILILFPYSRNVGIGCVIIIGIIVASQLFVYNVTQPIPAHYPIIARIRGGVTDQAGILTTQPRPIIGTHTIIIPSTNTDPHLYIWDHAQDTLYQAIGPLIIAFPSLEVQRGNVHAIPLDSLTPEEKKNLGLAVKDMLVEQYFPGSSLPARYMTYARYRLRSERNHHRWGSLGREVWERGKKLGEIPGGTGSLITMLMPFGQWMRDDHDSNLTTKTINQSRREGWNRVKK